MNHHRRNINNNSHTKINNNSNKRSMVVHG